jgi:hypothetical protein
MKLMQVATPTIYFQFIFDQDPLPTTTPPWASVTEGREKGNVRSFSLVSTAGGHQFGVTFAAFFFDGRR